MNIEQLKVFVSIVKNGGFHAAAKALHRSQPAITNAVKNLEKQLSVKLFDRSQYNIRLTAEGESLFKRAETLITHINELTSYAKNLQQALEPCLRIAIDTAFPLEKHLSLFKNLIDKYPNTDFQFSLEALGGAAERVLQDKADIAITDISAKQDNLVVTLLEKISLVAVATPQFIRKHKKLLSNPLNLKHCTQIIIQDSSQKLSKQSLGIYQEARHWIVSDIYSKKQVILAGIGWGRLPKYTINNELKQKKLKILNEKHFHSRDIELCLMRDKYKSLGPVGETVWKNLVNQQSK